MRMAGLAYVVNRVAGLSSSSLSHQEVLAVARREVAPLAELIRHLIFLWQAES